MGGLAADDVSERRDAKLGADLTILFDFCRDFICTQRQQCHVTSCDLSLYSSNRTTSWV